MKRNYLRRNGAKRASLQTSGAMLAALLSGLVLLQLTCMDMSSFYFVSSPKDECRIVADYASRHLTGNISPILYAETIGDGFSEADKKRPLDCSKAFNAAGLNIRPRACAMQPCAPYHIVMGRPRIVIGDPDVFELPVDYPCAGLCGYGGQVYFQRYKGQWRAGPFRRSWVS